MVFESIASEILQDHFCARRNLCIEVILVSHAKIDIEWQGVLSESSNQNKLFLQPPFL